MGYDSKVWSVVMWIGVVAIGLASLANPAEYGIPAVIVPYVKLVAFIATLVGAKLGRSYLGKSGGAQ